MGIRQNIPYLRLAGFLVLGLVLVGCSQTKPKQDLEKVNKSRSNLKKVYRAYQMAGEKLKRPPKNADDLKPYLAEAGGSEDSLVSASDDQPFEIIWDVDLSAHPTQKSDRDPSGRKRGGPKQSEPTGERMGKDAVPDSPILAYEKTGTSEGRLVLLVTGPIMAVKEDVFRGAKFAKDKKPK